jgi:hypothetical protein
METAPVCAALEWRRLRVWGSGMFLIFFVSTDITDFRIGKIEMGGFSYQCGQSSIASGVMRGSIDVAVMFGVVRRVRTGECESFDLPVVVVDG